MSSFNPSILGSITESISQILSQVDTGNPQDMIQLGLGMGMAIMQSASVQTLTANTMMTKVGGEVGSGSYDDPDLPISTISRNSHNMTFGKSLGSPHSAVTGMTSPSSMPMGGHVDSSPMNKRMTSPRLMQSIPENSAVISTGTTASIPSSRRHAHPIGVPYPTTSSSSNKKLNHDEEDKQRQEYHKQGAIPLSTMESARKVQIVDGLLKTPDVMTEDTQYLDIPRNADERMKKKIPILMYPSGSGGVGTETRTHPLAGIQRQGKENELIDPINNIKLLKHITPLPTGFHQVIFSTHVAKQEADYLPQVPNLPDSRTVGRVKPRSAALDWIAISFDPWSAGKAPVSSEFVSSLSANASKFFEASDIHAIDTIEMMRQENVADTFSNLEDIEGQLQQRAEITRAQVMAQDFKKISSLCRHNKYTEVEQLINQPDWSLPIDYQDEQGNTLLHIASQNGNKRMIKIFMRRGISLDIQNLQGQTAIHYLYGYGYADVGEYLVKKGANDSLKNNDGLTCYEGLGGRELALL